MTGRASLISMVFICAATLASAEPLTDAQVQQAITRGAKFKLLRLTELNFTGVTGFSVDVFSPDAWIQKLADDAKREMRPFGVADVKPEDRADVWRVIAYPSTPRTISANSPSGSSVTHVVIRTDDKAIVIQPDEKLGFEEKAQNALGAALVYNGLNATFPGDGVRRVWGDRQDREFVISVIGDDKYSKYDFTIKKKHFPQLK